MIGSPKKLLYAVEAVVDIAYNAGGDPVQSGEITRRQGIPKRYLEPVLQQLVRAGILAGVRGPRGGYRLARERRRISLGDITRVVQDLEDAAGAKELSRSDLGARIVRPMWRDLQEEYLARLDEISIEEVCRRAHDSDLDSDAHRKLNYSI